MPNKKEIKIIKKRVPIHRDSFFYKIIREFLLEILFQKKLPIKINSGWP